MAEIPENHADGASRHYSDAVVSAAEVRAWFVREVLPLEAALMRYLHHSWRNKSEIADLRQDVYVRVCEAAQKQIPNPVEPFVFAVARNLLINRVRRQRIVLIDTVADLDLLQVAGDVPSPDRSIIARDELRKLQAAIQRLPPRCREAVILGRIEGLSGHEIAMRMGISEATVSKHLTTGMYALADFLFNEQPKAGADS
jgi:RNA polymerase sigma-70 factor (ECF subfamily)